MYVKCLFYKEAPVNGYSGRAYTYHTELPLSVGSKVMLPVRGGEEKRGIVVMIHLDKPDFECSEITKLDEGEEKSDG